MSKNQSLYKDMYLVMAQATEQAVRTLVQAQQEAEELYISVNDSHPTKEVDVPENPS